MSDGYLFKEYEYRQEDKKTKEGKKTDYTGFVEKFKPKLTTDDCYTPADVYEFVRDYVDKHIYSLTFVEVVRPFWPGGDYTKYEYPPGCMVIDNPPFSILAEIVGYYLHKGIRFFLFAPALTLFNYARFEGVTCIVSHLDVRYENGAVVRTGFVTNCYPAPMRAVVDGEMYKGFEKEIKRKRASKKKACISFPDEVTSAALLGKIAVRGMRLEIPADESVFIRKIDEGKQVFGGGLLVSDRVAAELRTAELRAAELRAAELRAAELRAAELRAAEHYELSDREKDVVKRMGAACSNNH